MRTKSKTRKLTARFASLLIAMILMLSSTVVSVGATGEKVTYSPETGAYYNVMYYGDWTMWGGLYPQHIPADKITHLNYAFMDFDANANLVFTDKDAAIDAAVGMQGVTWGEPNAGILSGLQVIRAKNPNLRIGISVGGWTKSGDFSVVAADPVLRAKLVENLVKFVKYTDMDFIDVDWEYPGSVRASEGGGDEGTPNASAADKANFITLLSDLRAALDVLAEGTCRYYELSVALPASPNQLSTSINIPALYDIVDFANIMTYDMSGSWDPISGHHTALYTNPLGPWGASGISVDSSIRYLLANQAIAAKTNVGSAFYSRGFKAPGLFQPHSGALDNVSYKDLDFVNLEYGWDDVAKAPYLFSASANKFYTFDDVRSITEKANYVKQYELGGMFSWQQSDDKETVIGSGVRDELTNAIKDGLYGDEDLPDHILCKVNRNINVAVEITPFTANNQNGFDITITNLATIDESGIVLESVELQAETVKLPQIYIKSASGATFSASSASASPPVSNVDGCGVVNLAAIYNNRMISHDQSVSFQVMTDGPANVADIECIKLSQRIATDAPEISKQLIYGNCGSTVDAAPVITGADDVTIAQGSVFDPMQGVSASDAEDGDLTSEISVSGTVDTNTPGVYVLTYAVTDSDNQTTEVEREVTVAAPGNTPPVISGVANKTINVGDPFDPMQGVSASDAEDGDLTSSIVVTGTVNTAVAGTYTLQYSVKDSVQASDAKSCVITVQAIGGDPYDPNQVYTAGDIVIYNGILYRAKWWTQGGATPDVNQAWERVVQDDEPLGEYNPATVYVAGDKVTYGGQVYQAKWWTQGDTPGSSSVWELVN